MLDVLLSTKCPLQPSRPHTLGGIIAQYYTGGGDALFNSV
jgi:hypothetical protein